MRASHALLERNWGRVDPRMMTPKSFLRYFSLIALCIIVEASTGCSRPESLSDTATPSPTATASPSPTATISPSPAALTPTVPPSPTGSPFADVQLRLRELESQMDTIFTDSFRDFKALFDKAALGSSVELREQKDKYVARVYVPTGNTSKVNAKIENGALHITAETGQTKNGATQAARYEQIISLLQPVRADQMQIDRKQNVVIVTVPKTTTAVAAVSPMPARGATPAASPATSIADWDQRMIDEMMRMQGRMNEVFRNAFPNDLLNSANMFRSGSTVNVDDEKDKYVVHFTLPDRDLADVNVKFENGRLNLTAPEKKSTSQSSGPGTMQSIETGRYQSMITLPGPVKESEMKVDRRGATVVVTLSKA